MKERTSPSSLLHSKKLLQKKIRKNISSKRTSGLKIIRGNWKSIKIMYGEKLL